MNPGLDDVRLPWWGINSTSARRSPGASLSRRDSIVSEMSPGNSAAVSPVSILSTQELSLPR